MAQLLLVRMSCICVLSLFPQSDIRAMPPKISPFETRSLTPAQQFVLWTTRAWFAGLASGSSPFAAIEQACQLGGMPGAEYDIDDCLSLIATGAREPYSIGCPQCKRVHDAEADLISALAALQEKRWDEATPLLERHVKPDEAYMAGPPAYRWALAMKDADWTVARLLRPRVSAGPVLAVDNTSGRASIRI